MLGILGPLGAEVCGPGCGSLLQGLQRPNLWGAVLGLVVEPLCLKLELSSHSRGLMQQASHIGGWPETSTLDNSMSESSCCSCSTSKPKQNIPLTT
jgi:hypothetical protein